MTKPVIVIAAANQGFEPTLATLLVREGFEAIEVDSAVAVLQNVRERRPDLVIVTFSRVRPLDGLELACGIRGFDREVALMIIATTSSEELAIGALRAGAADYFKEPLCLDEVVAGVKRTLDRFHSSEPASAGSNTAGSRLVNGERFVGTSRPVRDLRVYLRRLASVDSNVLITGETGTGKELVAALIHQNSARERRPFISINCAAIPDTLLESELFGYERGAFTGAQAANEGKLKLADRGSVFFDEIGEMTAYAQAKLLRTIETKEIHRLGGRRSVPIDFRIIAATNQDLESQVAEGRFRKDLYFRLNVTRVDLPPLRERKEDIPLLIEFYIKEFNRRFGRHVEGFTEDALSSILRHDWPGNVRELKNLIEAVFVNLPAQRISFMDLPEPFQRRLREIESHPSSERERLVSALFATNWNKSRTAARLHWSRMTIYRKMAKYQLMPPVPKT
jgi:DNA-binding NtrC family response regulator